MITEIYIGNLRLDLYKEDAIELRSSVADITDISKNWGDFIQDFQVPASLNNNKIFKHYYDYNIVNGFDARIKVEGRIDLGGETFRNGKFSLTKVKVSKGVPEFYSLNFISRIITLKDKFKNDTLSLLDLSSYDHLYNSENVKTGLMSSLFTGSLIYTPLVKKQLYVNSDGVDNTQTDELSNIAYNGGANSGLIWSDCNPSIKNSKILEAIETKYNLTFSNDFFFSSEFQNSYLWLNNNETDELNASTQRVDFDGGNTTFINLTTDEGTFGSAQTIESYELNLTVTPGASFLNKQYTIRLIVNGEVVNETTHIGVATQNYGDVQIQTPTPEVVFFYEISCDSSFQYSASCRQTRRNYFGSTIIVTTTASVNTFDLFFLVNKNIPNIKVVEWLKGFVDINKLILIQGEDTTYVDTIDRYYSKGKIKDITKYCFLDSYVMERGNILNNINFKYKEPKTILNKQYQANNNNIPYGNFELYLYENASEDELLDGEKLDVNIPFELVLHERLIDLDGGASTNFQYGAIIGIDREKVNPEAVIHFAEPRQQVLNQIGFINDVGAKEVLTYCYIPSNCYPLDIPVFSYVFDAELNTWNGLLIENTLYKNHWKNTLDEIFDVRKRRTEITAKLPSYFLNDLALNDVLKIRENYFRINSFKVNLITNLVTFDLFNSLSNTIDDVKIFREKLYTEGDTSTTTIQGTNLTGQTITKTDIGNGTDWATVTIENENLKIFLTSNVSGAVRELLVNVGGINFYINQKTLPI